MQVSCQHSEDQIYEMPTDKPRAPKLWVNADFNLKIERLVTLHANVVRDVQLHLQEFVTEGNEGGYVDRSGALRRGTRE